MGLMGARGRSRGDSTEMIACNAPCRPERCELSP